MEEHFSVQTLSPNASNTTLLQLLPHNPCKMDHFVENIRVVSVRLQRKGGLFVCIRVVASMLITR